MNIFFLQHLPYMSVRDYVDKHVVKMPLEYAQMLCTAHQVLDGQQDDLYKPAHKNHPCTKWARENSSNYMHLYAYFVECLREYTHRYGKVHGCAKLLDRLATPPSKITVSKHMTDFPQAMPEQYKTKCAVDAYRDYYLNEKRHIACWTERPVPDWWK